MTSRVGNLNLYSFRLKHRTRLSQPYSADGSSPLLIILQTDRCYAPENELYALF